MRFVLKQAGQVKAKAEAANSAQHSSHCCRLLELCKEQKHLIGQEVVQHQQTMYVLYEERGPKDHRAGPRRSHQTNTQREDIVITVKRVEMQVNLVKKRKKEHVVSAAGKDVNLGYSIYKIF
jgi:hypothetical protein